MRWDTAIKKPRAAEQERADVAVKRRRWRNRRTWLKPERLVFVDEIGAKTNMARLRGHSLKGHRPRAAIPWGHWNARRMRSINTTTFVAAPRTTGLTAPMVRDGAMNGTAFKASGEQVLAPSLAPGDIVVMDNLPSHKVNGLRKAINKAGAFLLYPPPYSPHLNPIEMAFAKLKALSAKPPQDPSTISGSPSPTHSTNAHLGNAKTSSAMLDMPDSNPDPL